MMTHDTELHDFFQSLYMEKSVVRLFLVVVLCLLVPHVVSGDTEVRAPV